MKKENIQIPGPGYDNQIGDIYAVQKPVTHDCACTDLIHKIDLMTGIQSMGMEPDQIHGIYNDEMVANQIAEKIHKEFVDAALALEKKKHTVIEKIKKTMNKLEKARTECMGMIKENPLQAQDHKNKVAELTHKLDELTTKLEMIEKSKKNIEKREEEKKDLKEAFEVHFSDGIRQRKIFKDPKSAINFAKQLISTNKNLQNVDVFNAGPNFNSTADTDSVIAWWGDGSYMDNKSKKDPKLAAKKIK